MVFRNADIFKCVAFLGESLSKLDYSLGFLEERKSWYKSTGLYNDFDAAIAGKVDENDVVLVWNIICKSMKKSLDEEKNAVIITNFLTLYPESYYLNISESFEINAGIKLVKNSSNLNRNIDLKEVTESQLSLLSKLSKSLIHFILQEIIWVVAMIIKQDLFKLTLEFVTLGCLEAEHHVVQFIPVVAKDGIKHSQNTFNIITDEAKTAIFIDTVSSAVQHEPAFFKDPFINERKIQGPKMENALELAFQRERDNLRAKIVNLLEEDEKIKQFERKEEALRIKRDRFRALQLEEMKKFHFQQMIENRESKLRNQEEQKCTEHREVFVPTLPVSFGSFKGSKIFMRRVTPFPIEAKRSFQDLRRIKQQKQDLFNSLTSQLETKLLAEQILKKKTIDLERNLSEMNSKILHEQMNNERLQHKAKQRDLFSEWGRQLEFSKTKKLLNDEANGVLKSPLRSFQF